MGCAARVLDLDPLEEVRRMAHEQLDQWLEQMRPLFEQEKPPTLLELSQHFTRSRQQLLGGVLQSLADALYAHLKDQRQARCPCCGKPIRRKRRDPKHGNTLQGPVDLERGYFYCTDCRVGFHPLHEEPVAACNQVAARRGPQVGSGFGPSTATDGSRP
ncbi:hypothetical protein TVNIR_2910 [Thioalkalivibrio nitratireducens DSM 14787]|uniref:Uncharacterized protein n=1 Tax=Thioalkalivibrio nitratireducens (strain DSM 14787 / UNIQEM 213 / ALEN2) TaxID=1255043 RepID=L0DZR7_THIND|nr:hypothetical protein TVNIR_2910 [Thioalkalivibrio nitratireducens DSM 14787]